MTQQHPIAGGIIVQSRTELYKFDAGPDTLTYFSVDGTYSGDIDGSAAEAVVAVSHADGARTAYGFGAFTGSRQGPSRHLDLEIHGRRDRVLGRHGRTRRPQRHGSLHDQGRLLDRVHLCRRCFRLVKSRRRLLLATRQNVGVPLRLNCSWYITA